jgi:hypothetical protein
MGAFAAVALLTLALPGTAKPISPVVHPQSAKARIASQAPAQWVRKVGKYWTYYVPDAKWGASENASGIKRYHQDFTAFRTDTNVPTRGHVTVDIVDDRTNFLFGWSAYTRVAPADRYDKWGPVLEQMEHLLFYRTHDPIGIGPQSARALRRTVFFDRPARMVATTR